MLQLSDLLTPQEIATWRSQLLLALQGIGFVEQRGLGTGGLVLSGKAIDSFTVQIVIQAGGELGTASFIYRLINPAGVVTTSAVLSMPGDGLVHDLEADTGVTLAFSSGPTDGGDSFVSGDLFTFGVASPTFPVTAWQPGGAARTILEIEAAALADLDSTVAAIGAGGLLETAEGAWLTLLAASMYEIDRHASIAAQGLATLTAASGAGPFTITPGQLWISDAAGHRYSNATGGTLGAGPATLQLTWQAESPGTAFNVGNGTINLMVTALAGVTVNNPDPGSGDWLTVNGTDAEADGALKLRCRQRWPGLGGGATADVYDFWARTEPTYGGEVTRSKVVTDGTIAGKVDVYIAGAGGALGSPEIAAIQAYIDSRKPLCVIAAVASATNHVIAITAEIWVKAAQLTAAQAAAIVNLDALFESLPIGGAVAAGPYGMVSREEIIAALGKISGVVDLTLSVPAADVLLTGSEVATYTFTPTWHAV